MKRIILFFLLLCGGMWHTMDILNAYGINPEINTTITSTTNIVGNIYGNTGDYWNISRNTGPSSNISLTLSASGGTNYTIGCALGQYFTISNSGTNLYVGGDCSATIRNINLINGYFSLTLPVFSGITYAINTQNSLPVNGSCGSSATTYPNGSSSFSGSLCTTGTAAPSSPSFPTSGNSVTWSCQGSNGGTNATCGATHSAPSAVNGQCGSSATTYLSGSGSFIGSLCTTGTASPSSPIFPSPGNSVTWNCNGSNGGLNDNCIAIRQSATPIPGQCGTNANTYTYDITTYPSNSFCLQGTASPSTPSFPGQGGSVSWSCSGQNGGGASSCTASRGAEPEDNSPWWSFGLIDWLRNIAVGVGQLVTTIGDALEFKAEWLGFNFDFSGFFQIFSLNLNREGITPATSSCENILTRTQIYNEWLTSYGGSYICTPGYSTGTKPNDLLDYTPEVARYNLNFNNFDAFFEQNFYSRYQKFYGEIQQPAGNCAPTANIRIYESKFAYINNPNTDIIGYNPDALDNLRIVPVNITIFGVDISQKIQDFFGKILSFSMEMLVTPVNMLNIISDVYHVASIDYTPGNWYCFAGTTVKIHQSMMGGTLLNKVITETNTDKETYGITAQTSGASGVLYVITLGLCAFVSYRRLSRKF